MKLKVCLLLFLVFTTAVKAEEIANRLSLDWPSTLKKLTIGLAGQIPVVGSFISLLLDIFWPEAQQDIWSMISQQVEKLVDKKILDYEINERKSDIEGIKENMKRYSDLAKMRFSSDRGTLLNAIIAQCNSLKAKFSGSLNDIHIVKLTITLAYMHLTILKEHYQHGATFFGDFNAEKAKKNFESTFNEYKSHFEAVYPKWRNWRNNLIEANSWRQTNVGVIPILVTFTGHGSVVDKFVSDQAIESWSSQHLNSENSFRAIANAHKERIFNQFCGEYMQTLSQAFDLEKYVPGRENNVPNINPNIATVEYGPFQLDTRTFGPSWDRPGVLRQILLREYNSIDALQFKYQTHDGSYVGGSGGVAHVFDLGSKSVTGIRFGMSNSLVVAKQFHFSDGTSTNMLGNRGNWRLKWFNAGFINKDMRLVSVSMIRGTGPSNTVGIYEIRFRFQHVYIDPITNGPNTSLNG